MLTEEQHIKIVEIGNDFWEEFGALAAKHIARLPVELEDELTTHLQEKCSIYGSNYDDRLREIRND